MNWKRVILAGITLLVLGLSVGCAHIPLEKQMTALMNKQISREEIVSTLHEQGFKKEEVHSALDEAGYQIIEVTARMSEITKSQSHNNSVNWHSGRWEQAYLRDIKHSGFVYGTDMVDSSEVDLIRAYIEAGYSGDEIAVLICP